MEETKPKKRAALDDRHMFTVELDQRGSCGNVRVTLLDKSYRGRWSTEKLYHRKPRRGGVSYGIRGMGRLSGMPEIPGAHIEVRSSGKVRVYDPKEGDEEFWSLVTTLLNSGLDIRNADNDDYTNFKTENHDFSNRPDDFKTLVIHLMTFVERGLARLVSGRFPTEEEIDQMDGDELYDPGNKGPYKPRLKKDYPEWLKRQQVAGNV